MVKKEVYFGKISREKYNTFKSIPESLFIRERWSSSHTACFSSLPTGSDVWYSFLSQLILFITNGLALEAERVFLSPLLPSNDVHRCYSYLFIYSAFPWDYELLKGCSNVLFAFAFPGPHRSQTSNAYI